MRLPTLNQFFRHQVQRGFKRHGLAEPATIEYVSEMLTRFVHTRALYAIRDQNDRPLERVAELVAAMHDGWEPDHRAPDRHRRASVARHIGEYTLFMSGCFRERLRTRGELDYYLFSGCSAFAHCANYEANPRRKRVFCRLHRNFINIADALDNIIRFQLPRRPPHAGAQALISSLWRV